MTMPVDEGEHEWMRKSHTPDDLPICSGRVSDGPRRESSLRLEGHKRVHRPVDNAVDITVDKAVDNSVGN